jgi:hypothetical protein
MRASASAWSTPAAFSIQTEVPPTSGATERRDDAEDAGVAGCERCHALVAGIAVVGERRRHRQADVVALGERAQANGAAVAGVGDRPEVALLLDADDGVGHRRRGAVYQLVPLIWMTLLRPLLAMDWSTVEPVTTDLGSLGRVVDADPLVRGHALGVGAGDARDHVRAAGEGRAAEDGSGEAVGGAALDLDGAGAARVRLATWTLRAPELRSTAVLVKRPLTVGALSQSTTFLVVRGTTRTVSLPSRCCWRGPRRWCS